MHLKWDTLKLWEILLAILIPILTCILYKRYWKKTLQLVKNEPNKLRFRKRDKMLFYGKRILRKLKNMKNENLSHNQLLKRYIMFKLAKNLLSIERDTEGKTIITRPSLPPIMIEEDINTQIRTDHFLPEEVIFMLKSIQVFGHFEKPVFLELCKHFESITLNHHDHLFSIGDKDDSMYVVQTGQIYVYAQEKDGSHMITKKASTGDTIYSLLSVLDLLSNNDPHYENVYAKAHTHSTVLKLPVRALQNIFEKYPQSMVRLVQIIMVRLQRVTFLALNHHLGLTAELLNPICYKSHEKRYSLPGIPINFQTDKTNLIAMQNGKTLRNAIQYDKWKPFIGSSTNKITSFLTKSIKTSSSKGFRNKKDIPLKMDSSFIHSKINSSISASKCLNDESDETKSEPEYLITQPKLVELSTNEGLIDQELMISNGSIMPPLPNNLLKRKQDYRKYSEIPLKDKRVSFNQNSSLPVPNISNIYKMNNSSIPVGADVITSSITDSLNISIKFNTNKINEIVQPIQRNKGMTTRSKSIPNVIPIEPEILNKASKGIKSHLSLDMSLEDVKSKISVQLSSPGQVILQQDSNSTFLIYVVTGLLTAWQKDPTFDHKDPKTSNKSHKYQHHTPSFQTRLTKKKKKRTLPIVKPNLPTDPKRKSSYCSSSSSSLSDDEAPYNSINAPSQNSSIESSDAEFDITDNIGEGQVCVFSIKPGEFVDALSIITGEASIFTIVSRVKSWLAIIKKPQIYQILNEEPWVVIRLAQTIVSKISPFLRLIDYSLDWIQIEAGRALYRQNDRADCIYIVLNGRVRAVALKDDNESKRNRERNKSHFQHSKGVVRSSHSVLSDYDPHFIASLSSAASSDEDGAEGKFDEENIEYHPRNPNKAENFYQPKSSNANKREIIGEYGRGELVGLVEVLTLKPRFSTVIAIRDTELAKMPVGLLDLIKKNHPKVVTRLIHLLGQRLFDAMQTRLDNTSFEFMGMDARPLSSNLSTIALVPSTPNVPLSNFACELQFALNTIIPTLKLDSFIVKKELGEGALDNFNEYRLSNWLGQQEDIHGMVLYQCDYQLTNWTRRCVRQADCVLIVTLAESGPIPGPLESQLENFMVRAQRELIILHKDRSIPPKFTADWLNNRAWITSHHHVVCPKRMFMKKLFNFLPPQPGIPQTANGKHKHQQHFPFSETKSCSHHTFPSHNMTTNSETQSYHPSTPSSSYNFKFDRRSPQQWKSDFYMDLISLTSYFNPSRLEGFDSKSDAERAQIISKRNDEFCENDFFRIARFLTGTSVGLVLGGGGARGIAHVGMIKALKESGIPIDLIGGTSIGAFMSALYAEDRDIANMTRRARDWSKHMTSIWKKVSDLTYPYTAMFTGSAFNDSIAQVFKNKMIEDLWIPYFNVTTDISSYDMKVHTTGCLWRYVRASMTLSGYLPPLCDPHDGHLLLDGGYCNNLPADVAKKMGSNVIIAVDVGSKNRDDFTKYGDDLSGWWLLWKKYFFPWGRPVKVPDMNEIQSRLAYVSCNKTMQDIKQNKLCEYFRPPIDTFKTLQFYSFEQIFQAGYTYGIQALKDWKISIDFPKLFTRDRRTTNLMEKNISPTFIDLVDMISKIKRPIPSSSTSSTLLVNSPTFYEELNQFMADNYYDMDGDIIDFSPHEDISDENASLTNLSTASFPEECAYITNLEDNWDYPSKLASQNDVLKIDTKNNQADLKQDLINDDNPLSTDINSKNARSKSAPNSIQIKSKSSCEIEKIMTPVQMIKLINRRHLLEKNAVRRFLKEKSSLLNYFKDKKRFRFSSSSI